MTKKKKKKIHNKAKQVSSERTSRLNLPLILSIFAILISLGQLIFTIPLVLKYFDKVELKVVEQGIEKSLENDILVTTFLIENSGNNTAKNVELELRVLKDSRVVFVPDIFKLTNPNVEKTPAQTLFYELDELVPGEIVRFYVYCDFKNYLAINNIDTLTFDKPILNQNFSYGPHLIKAKHSLGKVKIKYPKFLLLRSRDNYTD